ncbi:MAG: thioredoxin family protein [Candidatus Aminicenantes bacterium]|nr:thioredoxin family protein [Candidatus Aminicenantes bacterium]
MRIPTAVSFAFFSLTLISPGFLFAQETVPELVGPLTQDDILAALPDWHDRMVSYEAGYAAIAALKDIPDAVQVEVYLGSWCSDSAAHVPAFFQVLNLVNSPRFDVSCMGVPRAQEDRLPYIAGKAIEKLPTFIIYVNGLEKGRVVETPSLTIEEDLLAILRSSDAAEGRRRQESLFPLLRPEQDDRG